MVPRLLATAAVMALTTGCATTSQTQWTPTIDTYGNSRAQYLTRDLQECRALSMSASGSVGEQAAEGAAGGALLGAAGGAAIGALLSGGSAGRGAGVGAVLGAMSGGTGGAAQTDAEFRRAFSNCMRLRGHNVIN